MLPTYLHLIASAVLPIYAGAHASLTRPSSAAKPSKASKARASKRAADEDSDEEPSSKIEGLSASDALWFPLFAACTLGALYLLIKWLDDPSIISKLLNWYVAVFGVFGIARLFNDASNILTSFIFPSRYLHGGETWKFDNLREAAISHQDPTRSRTSPFPGSLSKLPLPPLLNRAFWSLRKSYPTLCLRLVLRPHPKFHVHITPSTILSSLTAISLVLFYNLVSRPWYLTNVLGFAFAYNALQLISPTTSSTGTLILATLFLYDIYFVFYTPLMVTVATSLDIPAKLLFPRPPGPDGDPARQHLSMLGLGDVVLPGMMIGFALRMDLYFHYLKQQKSVDIIKANDGCSASKHEDTTIPSSEANKSRTTADQDEVNAPTQNDISVSPSTYAPDPSTSTRIIVKPRYLPATGHWGDAFWLFSVSSASQDDPCLAGTKFSKPYFRASLQGYLLGMCLTLGAMEVTGVPQPALLYLVPCVLAYFWGAAVWRGEVKRVWNFDESEEQKAEDKEKGEEKAKENCDVETKGAKETEKDSKKVEGGKEEEKNANDGGSSRSKKRRGSTTTDFLSLNLEIGVTNSRSTKGCSRIKDDSSLGDSMTREGERNKEQDPQQCRATMSSNV
ncbi:MAG: hypothetical protein LQ348_004749 [Seirophora lacunosa]|nr:MAG: hypothetical protein LQ348_004749 [Seirophora lacunosa]